MAFKELLPQTFRYACGQLSFCLLLLKYAVGYLRVRVQKGNAAELLMAGACMLAAGW